MLGAVVPCATVPIKVAPTSLISKLHPRLAKSRAYALPSEPPAPVMIAVLPMKESCDIDLLRCAVLRC